MVWCRSSMSVVKMHIANLNRGPVAVPLDDFCCKTHLTCVDFIQASLHCRVCNYLVVHTSSFPSCPWWTCACQCMPELVAIETLCCLHTAETQSHVWFTYSLTHCVITTWRRTHFPLICGGFPVLAYWLHTQSQPAKLPGSVLLLFSSEGHRQVVQNNILINDSL